MRFSHSLVQIVSTFSIYIKKKRLDTKNSLRNILGDSVADSHIYTSLYKDYVKTAFRGIDILNTALNRSQDSIIFIIEISIQQGRYPYNKRILETIVLLLYWHHIVLSKSSLAWRNHLGTHNHWMNWHDFTWKHRVPEYLNRTRGWYLVFVIKGYHIAFDTALDLSYLIRPRYII